MLWNSSSLRDNNGPWTVSLRELVNNYADETALASFFDGWSGGSAALAGATMPDYKLTTVYNASPARAITDMVLEAGAADVEDVITDEEDVTAFELGKLAVTGGMLSVDEMTSAIVYGTAGDTISLGEHHIYGSSRVGVQRYDSLQLANLLNLSDAGAVRSTLMSRVPWYSYAYADVISSSKKQEYDGTINTYSGVLNNTRNLGRRYYELTDHLGNVLATVLDRKTGVKVGEAPTLYDHWSADLASVTDYYPGGMMMPGRNLEWDWSRMGSQSQQKDDEIYGKGNTYAFKYRMEDARINRFFSSDPLHEKYPYNSDYAFSENRLIDAVEFEGLESVIYTIIRNLNKDGTSTKVITEKQLKNNGPLGDGAAVILVKDGVKHYMYGDKSKDMKDFIVSYEGYEKSVYPSVEGGNPTGGVGHKLTDQETKQFPVGTKLSEERITNWFQADWKRMTGGIEKNPVTSELQGGQKEAMTDFAFNGLADKVSGFKKG
ncbi:hypothetical protein GCM10023092_16120 [Rurimicrobium arvi]|uniref:Lysozyme n=2 Tax=Rurimicrobium arvi TaxID=2049916 RepID=A0ABP8MSW4_9BACT